MNEKNGTLHIRTAIRGGQPEPVPTTPIDRAVFILLDALQKPTDWLYNALQATEDHV